MQSASVLLRISASMFISDIGLSSSVRVVSLSGLGIRVMLASQNEFGSISSSAVFFLGGGDSFRKIGVNSSLNLIDFACEAIWSWNFCLLEVF